MYRVLFQTDIDIMLDNQLFVTCQYMWVSGPARDFVSLGRRIEFSAPHLSYLVSAAVVKHSLSLLQEYNTTPGAPELLTTIHCGAASGP